jgi:predicted membrane protein
MTGRYFIGGILILLGIGFLFDQVYFWDFSEIVSTWWPLAIILLGAIQLSKKNSGLTSGIFIIIVGLLLQADELGYLYYGFWAAFWPIMIIALGILMLSRRVPASWRRHHDRIHEKINGRMVANAEYNAIFSSVDQAIDSDEFTGTSVSAIFGGADIDLSDTVISPDGALLDLNVIFGSIKVRLPRNCVVKTDGYPIFGSLDNKTRPAMQEGLDLPVILIKYFAAFGSIELKN